MQFFVLCVYVMVCVVIINNYMFNKGFDMLFFFVIGWYVDCENEFDIYYFDLMLIWLIDNLDSLFVLFIYICVLLGNIFWVWVIFSLNNQGVIFWVEIGLILLLFDSNVGIFFDNDSVGLLVNIDNGVSCDSWQLYMKLVIVIYQDKVWFNGSFIYCFYEGNDVMCDYIFVEDLKNINYVLDQINIYFMCYFL